MSKRTLPFLVVAAMTVCGCQSMSSFGNSFAAFEPQGARNNPEDQHADPWIQDAGKVARTEHGNEKVIDPLHLRDVFMSNKAQSIEHNLGVGD